MECTHLGNLGAIQWCETARPALPTLPTHSAAFTRPPAAPLRPSTASISPPVPTHPPEASMRPPTASTRPAAATSTRLAAASVFEPEDATSSAAPLRLQTGGTRPIRSSASQTRHRVRYFVTREIHSSSETEYETDEEEDNCASSPVLHPSSPQSTVAAQEHIYATTGFAAERAHARVGKSTAAPHAG